MKNSNSSLRLEEIRRKYDTPTRRTRQQNPIRSSFIHNDSASKENASRDSILMSRDTSKEALLQRQLNTDTLRSSLSKSFIDEKYNSKNKISASITQNQQNYESNHYSRGSWKDQNRYGMYREKDQFKGEEEEVFKKIKEMKESLMGKSAYDKIRPTRSIIDPKEQIQSQQKSSGGDSHIQGYRIDNIDKINSKIQQILNCLKQNENRPKFCEDVKTEKQKQSTVIKTELSSKTNFTNYDKEKVPEQYPSSRQQFYIRQSDSIYQEDKTNKQPHTPQTVNGFKYSDNKRDASRARSFISSVQRESGNTYQLNSGKKLDDEITKIQDKIKHFEEEKKKLNIQFTPFNYTRSKSSADLTYRGHTVHKDKKIQPIKKTEPIPTHTKVSSTVEQRLYSRHNRQKSLAPQPRFSENTEVSKKFEEGKFSVQLNYKYDNNHLKETEKIPKKLKDSFEIKLIPVTVIDKNESPKSSSDTLEKSNQNWKISKLADKQDDNTRKKIRQQTEQGIEGRKKKLTQNDKSKSSAETNKLTSALCEQVKLDEQFRNNKILFDNSLKRDKWQKLEQQIGRTSLTLSKEQIKNVFKLTDEENNPFFSLNNTARQNTEALQKTLVQSYQQSQFHWKKQILNKFNGTKLQQQYFNKQKLDLQRKGYLVMQDLVRFLNIETGTFYRNRDMYLIFKRISSSQQINFDSLISTITLK